MLAIENLTDFLIDVADTLVTDFDLVAFLQTLTDHAAQVSGATAVGVVLADNRGDLQFMAASNGSGRALELFQIQTQEGPCRDCFQTASSVVNADLAHAANRWPHFAPHALDAGFRSVHAFPMRLRDAAIGALNLFSSEDERFADDEVRIVQALADIATIAILQERSIERAALLAEQLQGALKTRTLIEQARGVVAQRRGIDTDAAFTVLRDRARSTNRKIIDVAAEVLEGTV